MTMKYGIAAVLLVCGAASPADAADKQPLTVRDALETTRMKVGDDGESITMSPDGRRYAAMLIRGDIARDGVEVEIIAGNLSSTAEAKPRSAARLFTRGYGKTKYGDGGTAKLLTGPNPPLWIDNERIAFLWEDGEGIHQVVSVNVTTGETTFLTHAKTNITEFAVGPSGVLVYQARQAFSLEKSEALSRSGYVLPDSDAMPLLIGVVDGTSLLDLAWGIGERFVQTGSASATSTRSVKVAEGSPVNTYYLPYSMFQPAVSPNGKFAIVQGTPRDPPETWSRYEGEMLRQMVREWRENPRNFHSRQLSRLFLLSIDDASARPLWNAPMSMQALAKIRWAPDSRQLLICPTYLPLDKSAKPRLTADVVAVVDIQTGKYEALPIAAADAGRIEDAHWEDSQAVTLALADKRLHFRKHKGQWMIGSEAAAPAGKAGIRVEVRQSPNDPPAIYAIDNRTGQAEMVFDPTPQLRTRLSLGKVEFISFPDKNGHTWEGRLFHPVNDQRGQRYPLVIQTHRWGKREHFALYGQGTPSPTLGPGHSVYLGQSLANAGVAVLQVGPPPDGYRPIRMADEANVVMQGYEGAIEHLDAIGMIDRRRVGIMGHSRSGWHTEHQLAFSKFRYAAAIVDDNTDSSYFEAGIKSWADGELRNGANPFGMGMKDWLQNSPAFNAEHVRSPLLMLMTDSFAGRSGVIAQGWEMFSRLRHLQKPVEFFVAPDIERGDHTLQNPRQVLAMQERAFDWWMYWLQDRRDADVRKKEQYVGWDRLRVLRDKDLQQPGSKRLRWTVEAVEQ